MVDYCQSWQSLCQERLPGLMLACEDLVVRGTITTSTIRLYPETVITVKYIAHHCAKPVLQARGQLPVLC